VRAFAEWLYGTAPSVAIHSTLWLIRLLQATHLLTAGVAIASGLMIALRALGWQRADEPFDAVWRRFAPWLAGSLAVMVATGIAQTIGDPVREFTATSYWVKLTLLSGCVLGTLLLATVFVRNAYCRFLCPLGAALGILSNLTVFKIKRWSECKTCKICEKTCEWGAIQGPKIVKSECVRCDDCERLYMDQQKCPHWIILIRKRDKVATNVAGG